MARQQASLPCQTPTTCSGKNRTSPSAKTGRARARIRDAERRWPKACSKNFYRSILHLLLAHRPDFERYLADDPKQRGMNFHHDVHDWMGGWPYESISPEQTDKHMSGLGFGCERKFVVGRKTLGIFGSGCDEYVYRRD